MECFEKHRQLENALLAKGQKYQELKQKYLNVRKLTEQKLEEKNKICQDLKSSRIKFETRAIDHRLIELHRKVLENVLEELHSTMITLVDEKASKFEEIGQIKKDHQKAVTEFSKNFGVFGTKERYAKTQEDLQHEVQKINTKICSLKDSILRVKNNVQNIASLKEGIIQLQENTAALKVSLEEEERKVPEKILPQVTDIDVNRRTVALTMKKQRAEDEAAELKSKINEHNEKKIGAVYGPTGNNVEERANSVWHQKKFAWPAVRPEAISPTNEQIAKRTPKHEEFKKQFNFKKHTVLPYQGAGTPRATEKSPARPIPTPSGSFDFVSARTLVPERSAQL